ncbi:MAG: DNA alkylation repair protein [Pedobacter sp.]|nr:DNA alkylation repair protein [Pedobacter sp.]MDQ8053695.1 DNA alkylation repair protein [Pedobacter sp.]
MNTLDFIISELSSLAADQHREKLVRFGINTEFAIGISVPKIRGLAKLIGKDQRLSLELWETKIHEARILASIIGDPKQVTAQQIDQWSKEFNSWDVCDQACGNLFIRTPFWKAKALEYARQEAEFVKRCGFVLMAEAAVHLKKEDDQAFLEFLPVIFREAADQRNFVKKAVNWALRQIGKRNAFLHELAIATAHQILDQNNKKANWVALDALRELNTKFK